jgi:vesicle-fusing ATPase
MLKVIAIEQVTPDGQITSLDNICLSEKTELKLSKATDSQIKLTGSIKSVSNQNAVVKSSFKFEDVGIGGLDEEFSSIFRRAFASRIFPPQIIQKLGIQHVRGVLLYGPPGTGKTLMAREIGKMLNSHEPKIVNGPEILNKFVGQSEENIRNLFKDAEDEYKTSGDDSKLHIVIFDELDAICKQRSGGNSSGGTGVGDSVVNQLLSKMDGVDQLNNILIIGMTNRKDLIDEALLRPGRLEVHMEIGLPSEAGRLQILKIHTAQMKQNKALANDVDLDELASITKNFTGAEINGLVKNASSFAFRRHIKAGTLAAIDETSLESLQIRREDFLLALEEVHAAFGVNDDIFSGCCLNGMIHFEEHLKWIFNDCNLCVHSARSAVEKGGLVNLLLHGPSGSGKTSIAATIAKSSDFPFIKMISPDSMVGMSELAKANEIATVFNNAYKSKLAFIVVDCIERLLEYVPVGQRFSNVVLQTLQVCLKRIPPKCKSVLIVSTTSRRSLLEDLDMIDCFSTEVYVPSISSVDGVIKVLMESKFFSDSDISSILRDLGTILNDSSIINISVKQLINIISISSQDPENGTSRFLQSFKDAAVKTSFQ